MRAEGVVVATPCEMTTTAAAAHRVPARAKRAPAVLCRRAGGAAGWERGSGLAGGGKLRRRFPLTVHDRPGGGGGLCRAPQSEDVEGGGEISCARNGSLVAEAKREICPRRKSCGRPTLLPRAKGSSEGERKEMFLGGAQGSIKHWGRGARKGNARRGTHWNEGEAAVTCRAVERTGASRRPSRRHPSSLPSSSQPPAGDPSPQLINGPGSFEKERLPQFRLWRCNSPWVG
jgi:hypothetical protein